MHIARNCAMHSCTTCARPAGQQAKKLSSSIVLNSDESAVAQKLSLNVHTIGIEKNPVLLVISVERSSGSVEGSSGKQMTPELLNEAFLVKTIRCKTPQRTQ